MQIKDTMCKDRQLVGIAALGDLAVNSTGHVICGKAPGHICAGPGQDLRPEKREVRHA